MEENGGGGGFVKNEEAASNWRFRKTFGGPKGLSLGGGKETETKS